MMGQVGFFAFYAEEKVPLAIDRYVGEVERGMARRLFEVFERRLEISPYPAGAEFVIADIACYPWMVGANTWAKAVLARHLENKPATERWMKELAKRAGVQRGMSVEPPPKSAISSRASSSGGKL